MGALSYLTVATLGLALTPLPFVLKRITEAGSVEEAQGKPQLKAA